MRFRFSPAQTPAAEPSTAGNEVMDPSPRQRRGTTSMEYLVMLSFIFLAIIMAVQGIGVVTGGLLQNSANATEKTNSSP